MGKAEKSKESWQERRKKIGKKWHVPFICVEWICEQVSYLLDKSAIFEILEYAGRLTVLIAVIFYIKGCPERQMQSTNLRMQVENLRQQLANEQKAKHYQAWQVINMAQGKPGSGGRKDALEDLHKDRVSLFGVDISKAFLEKLNLEKGDLPRANFYGTWLWEANFSEANLHDANFAGAFIEDSNLAQAYLADANFTTAKLHNVNLAGTRLHRANLTGAILGGANLTGAYLTDANLAGARLTDANLVGANLGGANLVGTKLHRANLAGTRLHRANFTGAILWDANLAGASLSGANLTRAELHKADLTDIKGWRSITSMESANLYGVRNPPDGFIEWAKEHGALSAISEEFMRWEKMQEKRKEIEIKKQQRILEKGR